jgi:hypothetical protein
VPTTDGAVAPTLQGRAHAAIGSQGQPAIHNADCGGTIQRALDAFVETCRDTTLSRCRAQSRSAFLVVGCTRDEARLAKLRHADRYYSALEVDIRMRQPKRLGDAQPAGREQPEECRVCQGPQCAGRTELARLVQERAELTICEDVTNPATAGGTEEPRWRDPRRLA